MRQIKKLLLNWMRASVEILMISLVLCIITIIAMPAPDCYIWVAVLPLFSLLGICLHPIFKKIPVLDVFFDIVFSAALGYGIGQVMGSELPEYICMTVLGIILAIRGRAIASRPWSEVTAEYLYTLFMTFDLIFALLAGVVPVLQPFRGVAAVLGPIIVLAGLLTMNDLNIATLTEVKDEKESGSTVVSKNMKRQNRTMLLVIYGFVLALSLLGGALNGLKWLAQKLYAGIMWIVERFADNDISTEGGGMNSSPDMSGVAEKIEYSRNPFWEQFEEVLVRAVSYIAIAAAAIFLLFMIYKGLRKLFAWLKTVRFQGDQEETTAEEYTDTRERLVDLKDLPSHLLKQAKDWFAEQLKREPDWKTLKTVEEKVRALYRRAVYKAESAGFHYQSAKTAGQTLAETETYLKTDAESLQRLAGYYDAVRYGKREPEAGSVEELNRKI